jgi:hypothetical protein
MTAHHPACLCPCAYVGFTNHHTPLSLPANRCASPLRLVCVVPWLILSHGGLLFHFHLYHSLPLRLYRLRQVADCCALPVNDLIFFSHSLDHKLTHTLTQILTLCMFAWPACLRTEGRIPHTNSISTRGMATYIRIEINGYVQELLIQLPYLLRYTQFILNVQTKPA